MYIPRLIEPEINNRLFQGRIVIIYGPRRSGKTTLVQKIASDSKFPFRYLNCDEISVQNLFAQAGTSTSLAQITGDRKLIVIDEAQRVTNIGLKLKLLVDNFPTQQIIATGSSSFDLANQVNEPLTGRSWEFWLHPLSTTELIPIFDQPELLKGLEELILYGCYPDVVTAQTAQKKADLVKQLTANYLYKDVLKFNSLKSSQAVKKLLLGLALQIGQEVSYTELANLVGISKQTVQSYIEILEQAFVLFKIGPFSRNLRKEISKYHKIYFYDTGVRNAILDNFSPLSLRTDTGHLWENFVIAERKKLGNFISNLPHLYFWRTYDQQEIDLVEEKGGQLYATEVKWRKSRQSPPQAWKDAYPLSSWQSLTPQNFLSPLIKP